MTKLIKSINEIKDNLSNCEKPIGFVATMGSLHKGHISLIDKCKSENKTSVLSIYVNPLQFGPDEDYKQYPRNFEEDLKIANEKKIDYVFAPDDEDMQPKHKSEIIPPPDYLSSILCGISRKNHFTGVATIVNMLFNIIEPNNSYFGKKDLQQLYIINWLVKEFNLPVQIKACPIVREENGLACSSRNKNLNKEQKSVAANIYKSLELAKQNSRSGIFTASKVILESLIHLSRFKDIKIEYFEAREKEKLSKVNDNQTSNIYYLTAAKVGNTRLIDNIEA